MTFLDDYLYIFLNVQAIALNVQIFHNADTSEDLALFCVSFEFGHFSNAAFMLFGYSRNLKRIGKSTTEIY